jgi:hypothetical protein
VRLNLYPSLKQTIKTDCGQNYFLSVVEERRTVIIIVSILAFETLSIAKDLAAVSRRRETIPPVGAVLESM